MANDQISHPTTHYSALLPVLDDVSCIELEAPSYVNFCSSSSWFSLQTQCECCLRRSGSASFRGGTSVRGPTRHNNTSTTTTRRQLLVLLSDVNFNRAVARSIGVKSISSFMVSSSWLAPSYRRSSSLYSTLIGHRSDNMSPELLHNLLLVFSTSHSEILPVIDWHPSLVPRSGIPIHNDAPSLL